MADRDEFLNVVIDPATDTTGLSPGVESQEWLDVIVIGHFDDTAAQTCHGVSTEEPVPLDPAEIVLLCRSTFVVSKLEPDGSPP